MMKKFVLILAVFVLIGAGPAQAQAPSFTGGNLSVGRSASVRHAGTDNFTGELYYKADDSEPTASDTPDYLLEDGMQPKVVNSMPGDMGRWYMVIKPLALNPGEVKSERTDVVRGNELPYRPELGGYLLNLTALDAGKYHIRYAIEHIGESIVRQFLFFDFRSERAVTDQAAFVLTVYEPNKAYLPQVVGASPYLGGWEPSNGAKTFDAATGQPAPLNLVNLPGQPMSNMGTVTVRAFADQHQLVPGEGKFRLVAMDGSHETPWVQTVNGEATFTVPPGTYYIRAPKGQWQLPPNAPGTVTVPEAETTYVIIERRAR